MSTVPANTPTRCPLCGQPNACAMEVERTTGIKQAPCWCTHITFSETLLARIPEAQRGQACICAACACTQSS